MQERVPEEGLGLEAGSGGDLPAGSVWGKQTGAAHVGSQGPDGGAALFPAASAAPRELGWPCTAIPTWGKGFRHLSPSPGCGLTLRRGSTFPRAGPTGGARREQGAEAGRGIWGSHGSHCKCHQEGAGVATKHPGGSQVRRQLQEPPSPASAAHEALPGAL